MAQVPEFKYAPMFQVGKDDTEYYLLTKDYVSVGEFEGKPMLKVEAEGITKMINQAFRDVSFLLRRSHNLQVAKILSDPEASDNDKYVALTFLRNAEVAAKGQLPICQDTGTAIVHGEKGQQVWTGFCDEEAIAKGAAAITPTGFDWLGLVLICFVLPAILAPAINQVCRKLGWVKDGDLTLS